MNGGWWCVVGVAGVWCGCGYRGECWYGRGHGYGCGWYGYEGGYGFGYKWDTGKEGLVASEEGVSWVEEKLVAGKDGVSWVGVVD